MPTHNETREFQRDYDRLTVAEQELFKAAVTKFVVDLRRGTFRKGLRIKRFQRIEGAWEMTWADDGRALFRYGASKRPGDPHVIWLRIGGHEIFDE